MIAMTGKVKIFIAALMCLILSGTSRAAEMRRPLSTECPMYIFHIDTWNAADPQKIIDLIPEDMRPYTVFNISLSVTASVTKDGFRTAESWLRTCAENRVWALIQPASGGHSWFSDYDLEVYRYFYENYPNIIGFNYCEQFWGFNDADGLHPFGSKSPTITDRMNHFANLLDLADEYGGYLVISNCLVRPEWDATSPLTMFKRYPDFAAKAKEHKDHLIYCEKYTTSGNFYDMESMCLGVYLSDYCDFYGMRFDQCGYADHVKGDMPPAIGGMTILEHMMMTGQTVQDGPELIWQQCVRNLGDKKLDDGYMSRQWEFYSQFPNVYLDVWRKFTTDGVLRIMDRQEVIDSTKIAIYNDIDQNKTYNNWEGRRSHKNLFDGLYALEKGSFQDDTVYLKKTGRYPTVPTIFVDNGKDLGFQRVIKQSRYSSVWRTEEAKVADFNELFSPQTADDIETSLYVRRIDNNWLVYNNSQYESQRKIETSTLDLRYNTCSQVTLTMPMCSFGLVTEKADGIDFYLNNYVPGTNMTTDEISIMGCDGEPSLSYVERGSHKASTIEKSYADGTLTLKVTHNGPLDISVKCTGANSGRHEIPVYDRTHGCDEAPVYRGPRQYELENADYLNIDNAWGGATRSDIPGFTALGYVSYGTKSGAKLRDTISIDEAGLYKLTIRYLAPEADVDRVNVSIGGKVVARNLKFAKTSSDNVWATTVEVPVELAAGRSELIISSTKKQSNNLYLDNLILTPANPEGIADIEADVMAPYVEGCYNMLGQRVDPSRMQKGQLYIVNGKKLIYK